MAEGVHHRYDLYPNMKNTEAFEGIVNKGEMIFVPIIGVHVFESEGASLGIRYMNHDQYSPGFGKQLLQMKSRTVTKDFVGYLEGLDPFHEDNNDNVPNNLEELLNQVQSIAEAYKMKEKRRKQPMYHRVSSQPPNDAMVEEL
jgi:hypothetical protein